MSDSSLIVDTQLLRTESHVIAVLRCVGPVAAEHLGAAIATIDPDADLVAVITPETGSDAVAELVRRQPPAATATPVTDALKRLSGDRLAGSVDRSNVFRIGLPMLLDVARLRARLEELTADAVPPGLFLPPNSDVTLLDAAGAPLD